MLDDPDIERHKIETGEKRIICDWGEMETKASKNIPRAKSASKHLGTLRRDSRQKLEFMEESKGMDVSLPFNPQKSPKAVIPRSKIILSKNNPNIRFQDDSLQREYVDILKALPVSKRGVPTSAGNKK